MPSRPSSRPRPDSFQPPNGACRSVVSLTLIPTAPHSRRSAKAQARYPGGGIGDLPVLPGRRLDPGAVDEQLAVHAPPLSVTRGAATAPRSSRRSAGSPLRARRCWD